MGLEKINFSGLLLHFSSFFEFAVRTVPYDSVKISRETVYFHATLWNLRAKILYVPREKIPLRANRRRNLSYSRGPCIISRETI